MIRSGASNCVLAAVVLSTLASGQALTPLTSEFVAHEVSAANQRDGGISWSSDGSLVAYCWAAGQNIFARLYDGADMPLTPNLFVNDTIVAGNQDQPAVSVGATGNVLVAWSDREANDGQLIGIFARVYDSAGVPLTAEFQVNVEWQASQFRPALVPTASGGWVVTWTGQFDGDCFFRVLDANGSALTGDIFVNSFDYGAQVNPDVAVLPNGNIFVAFQDSSAHGGLGGGNHLWGRLFSELGAPLGPDFPLAETIIAGDQFNPRIAVSPVFGDVLVVWEDNLNDGSGWGIFGRLFDSSGTPYKTEFQLNTDSSGDQRRPDVSVGASGDFIVVWDSAALGGTEIRAQRLSGRADFFGPEVTISETSQGGYLRPEVAMDPSTHEVLFVYDGPAAGDDVFTRRFLGACMPNATNYCGTSPNSVGSGAVMSIRGSTSISADDFELVASSAPPNGFGIFFYGPKQVNVPLYDGARCVGGGIVRIGGVFSDGGGVATRGLNNQLLVPPNKMITSGSNWNFQYFYRDNVGVFLNYSDAINVTFCP